MSRVLTSVVDPNPNWIRIQELCGYGSTLPHLENQLTKQISGANIFLLFFKDFLLRNFFLKLKKQNSIDNMTMDPVQNSMYLDP